MCIYNYVSDKYRSKFAELKITFLSRKSHENLYSYNFENDVEEKDLKMFTFNHTYEIRKVGATPIEESILEVKVPTHYEDVKIAEVNQLLVSTDGQQYSCENIKSETPNSSLLDETHRRDPIVNPTEDRAIYMNCTSGNIGCQKFQCKIGPFLRPQSMAKLTFAIDFQLYSITGNCTKNIYIDN